MAKQPPSKKKYDRQYRKEKMMSISFRLSRSADQELIEIYERIPNKVEWFREALQRWKIETELSGVQDGTDVQINSLNGGI